MLRLALATTLLAAALALNPELTFESSTGDSCSIFFDGTDLQTSCDLGKGFSDGDLRADFEAFKSEVNLRLKNLETPPTPAPTHEPRPSMTISSDQSLTDAVNTAFGCSSSLQSSVTRISGATVTTAEALSCATPDASSLLLHSSASGKFVNVKIASVSGNTITLEGSATGDFDTAVVVPHFLTLTVNKGVSLKATPGQIFAFDAQTLELDGKIDAAAAGGTGAPATHGGSQTQGPGLKCMGQTFASGGGCGGGGTQGHGNRHRHSGAHHGRHGLGGCSNAESGWAQGGDGGHSNGGDGWNGGGGGGAGFGHDNGRGGRGGGSGAGNGGNKNGNRGTPGGSASTCSYGGGGGGGDRDSASGGGGGRPYEGVANPSKNGAIYMGCGAQAGAGGGGGGGGSDYDSAEGGDGGSPTTGGDRGPDARNNDSTDGGDGQAGGRGGGLVFARVASRRGSGSVDVSGGMGGAGGNGGKSSTRETYSRNGGGAGGGGGGARGATGGTIMWDGPAPASYNVNGGAGGAGGSGGVDRLGQRHNPNGGRGHGGDGATGCSGFSGKFISGSW